MHAQNHYATFEAHIDAIDNALKKFGFNLSDDDTTDPKVIAHILSCIYFDIHGLDQSLKSTRIFKRITQEKIELAPLKKRMIIGMMHNPSIYQTLLAIAQFMKPYQLAEPQKIQLMYALYLMVILESLTYLMVNDKAFERTVVTMLFKQRHSVNTGSTFWNFVSKFIETKGDLFSSVKTVSVDPFMYEAISFREYAPFPSNKDLDKFISEMRLTGLNARALKRSQARHQKDEKNNGVIYGNILEAVTKEESLACNQSILMSLFKKKKTGEMIDNIKAGAALLYHLDHHKNDYSAYIFEKAIFTLDPSLQTVRGTKSTFWDDVYATSDPNNYLKTSTIFTKEFVNTYHAWNMAFVLRNYRKRVYMFLPMLLMPTILGTTPEYYFASRVISLWLTINFISGLRKKNLFIHFDIPDLETGLVILQKNNYLYAKEKLLKNAVDLDKVYEELIHDKLAISNYIKAMRFLIL